MKLLLAVTPLIILTGCATGPKMDVTHVPYWFYNQPNNTQVLKVTGTNITISGVSSFEVWMPVPPKSMIPRDPTIVEKIVDGTVSFGKFYTGMYFGSGMFKDAMAQPRTVDPLVVEPTIVTVPGP